MRIVRTNYLDDGKLFNHGQDVTLIQISGQEDFDALIRNMQSSNYYDDDYFSSNLSHPRNMIKPENLALAAMTFLLRPSSLLELGCGRGDVLMLLDLAGVERIRGVDVSRAAVEGAFQSLRGKLLCGDLLEVANPRFREGCSFDLICGFDIWEHLHPSALPACLEAAREAGSDDALYLFVIPAFGRDRVFGELFPLEFGENRDAFEARRPFSHLPMEKADPPIPAQGHLILAHSEWWEDMFASMGLLRQVEVERVFHHGLDRYLARAQRSFYILSKDTPAARRRCQTLRQAPPDLMNVWRTFLLLQRQAARYQQETGTRILPQGEFLGPLDDALFRLLDSQREQLDELRGQLDRLGPLKIMGRALPGPAKRAMKRLRDSLLSRKRGQTGA